MESDRDLDYLSGEVIGAAIAVHKELGPGFSEQVYENALCIELAHREIACLAQAPIIVMYRGRKVGAGRIDVLVEDKLVVELKTVESLLPVHHTQVVGYLKCMCLPLGLPINFNVRVLKQGVRRVILSVSSRSSPRLRDESLR